MERIINSFAEYLALELELDKEKKEVIAYGAFAIIQIVMSIVFIIIFGIIFKCMVEALIISFTVSILRKYSGGVHASSLERCIVLGTLICIGAALIVKYMTYSNINFKNLIVAEIAIFIFSYIIIIKLSPVDSPEKPIKNLNKRVKMKKLSIVILTLYLICATVGFFMWNNKVITYSLCISIGVLWQTFTLTSMGHIFVTKLDKKLKIFI